jgi:DNA-binding transcriptional LysR family regulator
MSKPTLNDLTAFSAVAAHRSFRRAALELGLTPSSLSHTVRTLEQSMGVRLLHRTTRSVSLTEAGARFLARLGPALRDLEGALREVESFRSVPGGTVRINAPEGAVRILVRRILPVFRERYPDVALDFVSEGKLVDIVAEGFDAGVRLGEFLPQDMVAVRFGGQARFIAVAAPSYVARMGRPKAPDDLAVHECIRHRLPGGRLYRWEFERHGQEMRIDVPGSVTLDRMEPMLDAAIAGIGVAYLMEHLAAPHIRDGDLIDLLPDWCPEIPGLFLYYPGHRQVPAALRAFIDTLKELLP